MPITLGPNPEPGTLVSLSGVSLYGSDSLVPWCVGIICWEHLDIGFSVSSDNIQYTAGIYLGKNTSRAGEALFWTAVGCVRWTNAMTHEMSWQQLKVLGEG